MRDRLKRRYFGNMPQAPQYVDLNWDITYCVILYYVTDTRGAGFCDGAVVALEPMFEEIGRHIARGLTEW